MDLVLLEGPLEPRRLEDIARLYGPYNRKYSDPGFCDRLFNQNPHGGSLHAFALDEQGRAAGHYAVIPTDILVRGERKRSGKGEAFVVHEEHRRETVSVAGRRPILCGPALQHTLLEDALERGLEVVHMIAGGEVALIHRITGCRALGTHHRRSGLVLRPGELPAREESGWSRTLRDALGAAQRTASAAMRAAAGSAAGIRNWSGADLTAERLAHIAADLPAPRGWGLAIDVPALAWMARAGTLQLLASDEAMTSWALVCASAGDGRTTEILAWRERGGRDVAIGLLAAAIHTAAELGSVIVGFSETAAPVPEERERLRGAGRTLLLREREQETGMFVRSRNAEYSDPSWLQFSPFFYGIY